MHTQNTQEILKEMTNKWGLTIKRRFSNSESSEVYLCSDDKNTLQVLKVPFKEELGRLEEYWLCRVENLNIAPKMLKFERRNGVMLMEYIPEFKRKLTLMEVIQLDKKTTVLSCMCDDIVLSLQDYIKKKISFSRKHWVDITQEDVALIDRLIHQLSYKEDLYLMHGDFQSKNIIPSTDKLKLIDPLPVLAPKLLDICQWAATSSDKDPLDLCHAIAHEYRTPVTKIQQWYLIFLIVDKEGSFSKNVNVLKRRLGLE